MGSDHLLSCGRCGKSASHWEVSKEQLWPGKSRSLGSHRGICINLQDTHRRCDVLIGKTEARTGGGGKPPSWRRLEKGEQLPVRETYKAPWSCTLSSYGTKAWNHWGEKQQDLSPSVCRWRLTQAREERRRKNKRLVTQRKREEYTLRPDN